MRPEFVNVGDGFLKPAQIINSIEADVAFSAKEAAHAQATRSPSIATLMVMVNAQTMVASSILRRGGSADTTTIILGCGRSVKPRLIDAIFAETDLTYFSLHPVWAALGFYFGISLVVLLPIFAGGFHALFTMFVIALSGYLIVPLAILAHPFIMQGSRALLAAGIPAILTMLKLMELFERHLLQTARTLARGGIDWFGRGHVRSVQRMGIARRVQRLTPSVYLRNGGIYG